MKKTKLKKSQRSLNSFVVLPMCFGDEINMGTKRGRTIKWYGGLSRRKMPLFDARIIINGSVNL